MRRRGGPQRSADLRTYMARSGPQGTGSWTRKNRHWLVAALIGGAAVVGWKVTRPKPVPPPKAPLVQQITALGRLTPDGGLVKKSVPAGTVGGRVVVERWVVQEGSPMRTGQGLAP